MENSERFYIFVELLPKVLELQLMMGYRNKLQYKIKADSFEKNTILATYNVFTENLGKLKGVTISVHPFLFGYILNKNKCT